MSNVVRVPYSFVHSNLPDYQSHMAANRFLDKTIQGIGDVTKSQNAKLVSAIRENTEAVGQGLQEM